MERARASGSPERLVQLLPHPSEPDVLVVRFGVASEGYLYSRDGGRTFAAVCSEAIDPTATSSDRITRLSGASVPSAGATLLDGEGRVLLAHYTGFWSDDGTGCGWRKEEAIKPEQWVYSIQRDPRNADETLGLATVRLSSEPDARSRVDLLRRDARGSWTLVGTLKQPAANETLISGELLAVPLGSTGTRLYASYSTTTIAGQSATTRWRVAVSDDGGKVWREAGELPSGDDDLAVLLAVDPANPDRLLVANRKQTGPEDLLLSDDRGKTLRKWAEVYEVNGVTFTPDGRVFVADGGDQEEPGGVWTAAKLGDPLNKLEGTSYIDCIGYDAKSEKLRTCSRHRFGLTDPRTGAFEELSRLDTVDSLVSCSDLDVHKACERQFNSGPAWCCTGHFTFTPFCGSYDVTRIDNRNVYCGLAGRAYDESIGLGPDGGVGADADGGVGGRDAGRGGDAGRAPASNGSGGGGGCAVGPAHAHQGSPAGALVGIGLLLVVLGRTLRRRAR